MHMDSSVMSSDLTKTSEDSIRRSSSDEQTGRFTPFDGRFVTAPTASALSVSLTDKHGHKKDLRKGDTIYRRGEPCTVVKFDHSIVPPSLLVEKPDGQEVETEAHAISFFPPSEENASVPPPDGLAPDEPKAPEPQLQSDVPVASALSVSLTDKYGIKRDLKKGDTGYRRGQPCVIRAVFATLGRGGR